VLHDGVHELPLVMLAVHVPRAPFIGAETTHGNGLHVTVSVRAPAKHALLPDSVYPLRHVGAHELPLASVAVQSPASPFVGAADASHGLAVGATVDGSTVDGVAVDGVAEAGASVALQSTVPDRVPAAHVYKPDKMYPVSQAGVHVLPLARLAVQPPRLPLVGAETVHGVAVDGIALVGLSVVGARVTAQVTHARRGEEQREGKRHREGREARQRRVRRSNSRSGSGTTGRQRRRRGGRRCGGRGRAHGYRPGLVGLL
jgi:hypothetical protein